LARSKKSSVSARSFMPAVWLLGLFAALWFFDTHMGNYGYRAFYAISRSIEALQPSLSKNPLLQRYEIHGIDVSHYQRNVDWASLQEDNITFAFMKATEGVVFFDSHFKRNWEEARKANIVRGAYHFFHPSKDAETQANHFLKHVQLLPGDLPPVLDVEITSKADKHKIRKGVRTWLNVVEKKWGIKPIIYTNYDFYIHYLDGHFDEYPLWIAHYEIDSPRLRQDRWTIWQLSEKAELTGIGGSVDFNVFKGSRAALDSLCYKGSLAKPL
jgi:lysozyme